MRFAFTEQQLELRAAVRQVLERQCTVGDLRAVAGRAAGVTAGVAAGGGGRSVERWAALSDMGAPGLLVPEAHGGLGLCEVEMVGVLEESGWAALPEPLAESAAMAAPLLAGAGVLAAGGAWARVVLERHLPRMATGELVATVGGVDVAPPGRSGPDARSAGLLTATGPASVPVDAAAASRGTVATRRVPGATRAGLFLLAWAVPGSGWQVHAVEAHATWVVSTPSVDGTRDLGTVEWTPWPHTVIASGDHAASLVADLADRASMATAAQLLGLADRMISLAADYARERRQFGRPIGSFQAVQHQLADARVKLEFARPAVYRAADSLARRLPDRSEHASMAKALASDAADLAARAALQVHGAVGYTWECDLHLFMKRSWALSAAWGSAPVHRARVLAAARSRVSPI